MNGHYTDQLYCKPFLQVLQKLQSENFTGGSFGMRIGRENYGDSSHSHSLTVFSVKSLR